MEIDVTQALQEQMGPNEHLLWSGQPAQGLRLRASDAVMVPFSFMWGGFALFWEWSVLRSGAPLFFKLWGVPFVLVGLHLIVGRFFWDSYQRRRTYYGVSDQRVLIITGGRSATVKSMNLRTLSDISVSSSPSGSGVIQFGAGSGRPTAWLATSGWPGAQSVPTFELAAEAKRVYEVIRAAQQKAA